MAVKYGLLGNVLIRGNIKAKSGLHIGASAETVEIGGIDSPVIKHPLTGAPFIPGSSLKGKMRSFQEKVMMGQENDFRFNRNVGSNKKPLWIHVCDDQNNSYKDTMPHTGPGAVNCPVCRVYGSTGFKDGANHPSRLIVRDCILTAEGTSKIMEDELFIFEAKMENAIDRMTAQAQPRTFERVPAGAEFEMEIVYKLFAEKTETTSDISQTDIDKVKLDLQNIFTVLHLIQLDGLGGSISRGYGNVDFELKEEECLYYPVGKDAIPYLSGLGTKLDVLRNAEFNIKSFISKA